jgi:large subunit ribosomal protein L15
VVNVADLEAAEGAKLGPAELAAQSLIRSADALPLKVLGNGEITRAVTVSAHAVSASAKAKIEKAGGKVVLLAAEAKPE